MGLLDMMAVKAEESDTIQKHDVAKWAEQAKSHWEAGDQIFQIMLTVGNTSGEIVPMMTAFTVSDKLDMNGVLNAILSVGWKLTQTGFAYQMTTSESRDKFMASGQQTAQRGRIMGVYIFERGE
jgi:hypothetical protein